MVFEGRYARRVAVVLVGLLSGVAGAVNPANWQFTVQTLGEDSYVTTSTAVDNWYRRYDYEWEVTSVEVYVSLGIFGRHWINVTSLLEATGASGTHVGPLAAVLYDDVIVQDEVSAHVYIYVDANGYGRASITDVQLGSAFGYNVQGIRVKGTATVTGIFSVQAAIDHAAEGEVVVLGPGVYDGDISFGGKNIVLTSSDPQDASVVAATVLVGSGAGPVVTFAGAEDESCELRGLTITGGAGGSVGGGISGNYCTAKITRCVVSGNEATWGGGIARCNGAITECDIRGNVASIGGGGLMQCDGPIVRCLVVENEAYYEGGGVRDCDGDILNCTIAFNVATTPNVDQAGGAMAMCDGRVTNCIVRGNTAAAFVRNVVPTYSCVPPGTGGLGNIESVPGFVGGGDYHLLSAAGRWAGGSWVYDGETSRCVDAGSPAVGLGAEPVHGANVRINLGAYGGTAEASRTPTGWSLLTDLSNDGQVGLGDFAILAGDWLVQAPRRPGDLGRDGQVELGDLQLLAGEWANVTVWR